ncbi:hypothetical protein DVS28_a2904 [Euzebya pacifica]|uniref:Uncharacterized protein n=1 Tax=Euzebya pacifica TaxID=1608957 RepID=A0A346XZD6_9ACTN|nr:hypothetical protein [Euzebya pacifica]AXV07583.1 hypothetical protein DVS28_a2904 [Euzebya pacifica]
MTLELASVRLDGTEIRRVVDGTTHDAAVVAATVTDGSWPKVLRGAVCALWNGRTGDPVHGRGSLLEVRHDTTMWNEGFELALRPVAAVLVSPDDAEAIAAEVAATHGRPAADRGRSFTTRIVPDVSGLLWNRADATELVGVALRTWRGL